MRLYVGVIGAKKRLGAIDGDLFDLIDDLAPAVVALPRQSLRVLVRERAAHGFEHGRGDEVLTGDELQPVRLAFDFLFDQSRDVGVRVTQRRTGGTSVPFT